jgi:hypothetical protein
MPDFSANGEAPPSSPSPPTPLVIRQCIRDRVEYWRLTVHWYPHAAEAGVRPYIATWSNSSEPGGYSPHDFDFERPPSRQDFLMVCQGFLPWTSVWQDNLLEIIRTERCPWPMIDSLHKASTAYIDDSQGRQIGELRVCKERRFINRGYTTHYLPGQLIDRLVRGYKGNAREALHHYIETRENWIKEALSALERPIEESDIAKAVRSVITQWKKERKTASK